MRKRILFLLVWLCPPWASALEQPFAKAEYYKKNLPFEDFAENPHIFFVSDEAFGLLVRYVSEEIGQNITKSDFVALMNSERVQVRKCPTSEKITTGAYAVSEFSYFDRYCRLDEEIVQVRVNDEWRDVFSLNCLNVVVDKTPGKVPDDPPKVEVPPQVSCRSQQIYARPTVSATLLPGSVFQVCLDTYYTPPLLLQSGQGVQGGNGYVVNCN